MRGAHTPRGKKVVYTVAFSNNRDMLLFVASLGAHLVHPPLATRLVSAGKQGCQSCALAMCRLSFANSTGLKYHTVHLVAMRGSIGSAPVDMCAVDP